MACPYASALLERLALQKLHDDEGLACVLINVVDDADVGVIQRPGGPRLACQPLKGLMVFRQSFRQELEGH
jgi:hypothetical protein